MYVGDSQPAPRAAAGLVGESVEVVCAGFVELPPIEEDDEEMLTEAAAVAASLGASPGEVRSTPEVKIPGARTPA